MRESTVNIIRHRAVRERHSAASLTFCRVARVNILGGGNIGEGYFVVCSVAILSIACVQIAGERRPVGEGYLIV